MKRKVFSLALKDERVEQCLRSSESKRKCKSHESCVCIVGFSVCGCQNETERRHVAVHKGKHEQNHL